jgi:hypothetical protein
MIYSRKKKYEVIRIPCLRCLSIPPIMRPGLSVVPPNGSATPPVIRMVRSALDLSNSASRMVPSVPISRRESEVLRPMPTSRGTGRGSHSPSEQTAVHALLGSHQLQASHVVPGSRGSPKRPWRVPRHSHPLLFFESNLGSGKTSRTSVLVFPNPWADPTQHTVHL